MTDDNQPIGPGRKRPARKTTTAKRRTPAAGTARRRPAIRRKAAGATAAPAAAAEEPLSAPTQTPVAEPAPAPAEQVTAAATEAAAVGENAVPPPAPPPAAAADADPLPTPATAAATGLGDSATGPEVVPATGRDRDDGRPEPAAGRWQSGPAGTGAAPAGAQAETPARTPELGEGLVEVSGKGFGFLRDPERNYTQSPRDIFITPEVVRRHGLRDGQWVKGEIRRGNRGFQLFRLTAIEGEEPDRFRNLPIFEELTTLNPDRRIKLETTPDRYTTRVMDMMTPVGKGQRGLIVAPPRTGKTTLLEHIADAVLKNHPDIHLIILLVDERPEEVTEIRRTCPGAEIMASSNDSDVKSHTRIAMLAIERAKRLVEIGRHVFVVLDSLTRVGRAFNNAVAGGGRTLSGGMDARAMEIPRKLFAAARNTEEAGSLTIVATALIETGSRMDELIFQEFKGTGNMELVLARNIADQRIYPAVDIFLSGTRREELLLPEEELYKISLIRRGLSGHKPIEAIERLLSFLKKFPTNTEMLRGIPG